MPATSERSSPRPSLLRAALAATGLCSMLPAPAVAQLVGPEIAVNTFGPGNQSLNTLLHRPTGEFVVTWTSEGQDGSGEGVYARVFAADGSAATPEFRVASRTVNDQRPATAAMDAAGNFAVVWQNFQTNANSWGIQARLFHANGAARTPQFDVNTHFTNEQTNAAIGMAADGSFVIQWRSHGQDFDNDGVYARVFEADGTPRTGEIQVPQATAGNQYPHALLLQPDGGFVSIWQCDACDGSSWSVQARMFDASGAPRGDEFRVNEQTSGGQVPNFTTVDPAGNFVIGWLHGCRAYIRRYVADGTPSGGEFRVSETGNQCQDDLRYAVSPAGNFVAHWSEERSYPVREEVRARNFDAGANPRTGDVAVNTWTTNEQIPSHLAVDAAGNFVVVWRTTSQFSGYDVMTRAFAANGEPRSGETRVNNYLPSTQSPDDLAMDANGDYLVVWVSDAQDGSGSGVYARPFRSDGVPRISGELQLNSYTAGHQNQNGVRVGADGRYLVLWDSQGQDGDRNTIVAAQVDLSSLPPCNSGHLSLNNLAPTVEESDGRRVFVVNRTGASCGAVSVAYAATAGTALAGADFTPKTGFVSWADGDDIAKRFTIPILQDALDEDLETVEVALSAPGGNATIGAPATLRILDDDPPSRLSIRGTESAPEGSDTSITISLDAAVAGDVTVRLLLSGTAERAVDYVFREQYVTIPAGSLEVTRDLRSDRTDLKDDDLVEGDETIVLTLAQPVGAVVSETAGAHTITIVDTD